MGNLYIVATPIGNLEDITYRAVRILGEVDFVFAEDTRTTGILFKKYSINTKLISYNAHNQEVKNKEIIRLLVEGNNLALVSDAGTPGVSDPGYSAVRAVREWASDGGLEQIGGEGVAFATPKIVPIPGCSALTAFVSSLGYGTHAWTFYGFLPHKNGRSKMLKEMLASEKSSIFYESTHRLMKCLEEVKKLGTPRRLAIGKELTKIYEEILIGTPEELIEIFTKNLSKQKGEFVIMII